MMRIITMEPRSWRAIQGIAVAVGDAAFTRSFPTGSPIRNADGNSAQCRYPLGTANFESDTARTGDFIMQCQRLARSYHGLELDRMQRATLECNTAMVRNRVQCRVKQHDCGNNRLAGKVTGKGRMIGRNLNINYRVH